LALFTLGVIDPFQGAEHLQPDSIDAVSNPGWRCFMENPNRLADRYVAVWNETDAERRRNQIAQLWTVQGRHFVADREVKGYAALEKRVRESHEKNVRDAGNRFRVAGGARRLHDTVTFHWEMLPADGDNVLARGLEFLIVDDDGKIVADYQFIPA
jgi:hypothetical protein